MRAQHLESGLFTFVVPVVALFLLALRIITNQFWHFIHLQLKSTQKYLIDQGLFYNKLKKVSTLQLGQ